MLDLLQKFVDLVSILVLLLGITYIYNSKSWYNSIEINIICQALYPRHEGRGLTAFFDKEAENLRNLWVEKNEQIDSDILFFVFLVQSCNTSTNAIIDNHSAEYEIEVCIEEIDFES